MKEEDARTAQRTPTGSVPTGPSCFGKAGGPRSVHPQGSPPQAGAMLSKRAGRTVYAHRVGPHRPELRWRSRPAAQCIKIHPQGRSPQARTALAKRMGRTVYTHRVDPHRPELLWQSGRAAQFTPTGSVPTGRSYVGESGGPQTRGKHASQRHRPRPGMSTLPLQTVSGIPFVSAPLRVRAHPV